MIAFVRGSVAAVSGDRAVIDVGGVGLRAAVRSGHACPLRVGEHADLATALVVREDSLTLYGFADADERAVFEVLQTVTGVGPKLAQAALAVLGADGLRTAVAQEDLATLTQVPGIGRKGAAAHGARPQGPAGPRQRPSHRPPGRCGRPRRRGAIRCTPRCSAWAGRRVTRRRPSRPSRPTQRWPPPRLRPMAPPPMWPRCCGPPCVHWAAHDRRRRPGPSGGRSGGARAGSRPSAAWAG